MLWFSDTYTCSEAPLAFRRGSQPIAQHLLQKGRININNRDPRASVDLVYNKSKTTGATCVSWTAYPSRTPDFIPVVSGVRVVRSSIFCVMFCRSLFVLLSFFYWSLHCLSYYGFWLSLCFLQTVLIKSHIAFFIITLFVRLFARVGILLTRGNYLHDCIIWIREELWDHKTSFTPPLLNE